MSAGRAGEPRLAGFASWLVLAASFGLSAATWVALGELAGFGGTVGVLGLTLRLAYLMPVAVDGYVVVALLLWMAPVPARVARFARANTYAAASIGVCAQSAYHALVAWSSTGVLWRAVLAAVVGALPPGVAALAVHMRALLVRESGTPNAETALTLVSHRPLGEAAPIAAPVPVLLPPVEAVAPQVAAPVADLPLPVQVQPVEAEAAPPSGEPEQPAQPVKRPRKSASGSVPRRSFALTQQAAASMEAGGMTAAEIAVALGITERQVRNALKPVPVEPGAEVAA